MEQLLKKAKFIAVFIFAISFIGCEEDETVLPKIIADFSYTLNEESATLTFINTSEGANKYEWNFGEGEDDTSTEINPVKTYTQSGTYTITLKASNNAGASDTFEDEITITILEGVALPVTFDDSNIDYSASVFSGASFQVVDNPAPGGTNDVASSVGAITNSGATFEGFFFDLVTAIDLTENKTITVNFWAEAPVDLLLKLEEGTTTDEEIVASHGGTGWETLSFNFASDGSYSRFTLFVDGPGTTSGTFYIDDIIQMGATMAQNGCTDTPIAATALPLNFEGCDTFPTTDNFGEGLTSMLAENPDKTGINTSGFVLQIDKPTGSDFFAGVQNTFTDNFDLTTTDTFKAKVYSTKANVVFRFELLANPNDGSIGNPAPVFVTIPNANEWTAVEILFTGLPAGPMAYNQLVIKPDNNQTDDAITNGGTYYIDDLTLEAAGSGGGSGSAGDTVPTTSAPVPPSRDAADVISIYGDSYTNVAGINYDPNWGQSGHQQVDVSYDPGDGNLAMAYLNFNYQGTDFSATPQDASSMEFLHIDMWTADATDVGVTPINGAGAPTEALVSLTPISTGQWNSYDIAISEYTASGMTLDQIIQMKFDGQAGTTPSNIYLDNIYFYKEPSMGGGTVPTTSAPVPPSRDAADVISIYGDSYTNVAGINYDPNWGQSGHQQVDVSYDPGDGNLAMAYLNFNYQGTDFSATPQDASSMEFLHIDMWTADATDVGVTPINGAGAPTEALVSLTPISTGQWNSYDIAISEYTASGMTLDQIIQMKFDGQAGTTPSNIYLDNIYFYKSANGGGGGGTGGCAGDAVAATTIPVDFEGCESFINSFSSIGDNGVVPSLDANPSVSGINTSNNVLKVVKASGINRWGGVQNSFPTGTIDITTKVFKIKVYSTVADVTYRFELALDPQTNPVTGNPAPVFRQVSGGANTWTEIEFTFINLPASADTYNQLVIKPDNPEGSDGEVTTEERTFYFDDLRLE